VHKQRFMDYVIAIFDGIFFALTVDIVRSFEFILKVGAEEAIVNALYGSAV
jgi:hypothetical protein